MADFCRQCSLELFGKDNGDLAGLGENPLPAGFSYHVLCEGCGFVGVNDKGECCSPRPVRNHEEKLIGCFRGHGGGNRNVLPYDETESVEVGDDRTP